MHTRTITIHSSRGESIKLSSSSPNLAAAAAFPASAAGAGEQKPIVVSAPLIRGRASTTAPIFLSLSLANATSIGTTKGGESSEEDCYSEEDQEGDGDIFDKLDAVSDELPSTQLPTATRTPRHGGGPLIDSTSLNFPSISLPSLLSTPSTRITPTTEPISLPEWLSKTSSKVTAIATSTSLKLRVAVGLESGSLYIFSSLSSSITTFSSPSPHHSANPNQSQPPSTPPTPITPPLTSPLNLPQRSRHTSTSSRPSIARQSSTASFSFSPHQRRPTSPTPTTSSSFFTDSTHQQTTNSPRLRKASATVGVSVDTSTLPGSGSLGPKSPTLPSLILSSPSPPPPTPTVTSTSANQPILSSASSIRTTATGGGGGGRRHKTRESITSGIGLWEGDSVVSGSQSVLDLSNVIASAVSAGKEQEEVEEGLKVLRVETKVVLKGRGPVRALRVLDATRLAGEEGGKTLLVLRSSGHLSLHSLVDGRELGSCELSKAVEDTGRSALVSFLGVDVIQFSEGPIALCYGSALAGLVVVDLDTLISHEAVTNGIPNSMDDIDLATIFRQGIHFLVFTSLSSSTSSSPPELFARPVLAATSSSNQNQDQKSLTALETELPHSVGKLEMFEGPVKGIRNCSDDLIVFERGKVLLFTIREQKISVLGLLELENIVDVCVQDYNIVLILSGSGVSLYRLEPSPATSNSNYLFTFTLLSSHPLSTPTTLLEKAIILPPSPNSAHTNPSHYLLAREETQTGERLLDCVKIPTSGGAKDEGEDGCCVFKSFGERKGKGRERVTKCFVLDRGSVLLGFSSGSISLRTYEDFTTLDKEVVVHAKMAGAITVLDVHDLGGRPVVIAGSSEGNAAAWDLGTWQLLSHWSLFASPVLALCYLSLPLPSLPSSTNSIAFISSNSPIALVSLFPPQLHFILPGTKHPVQSISTLGDEMLVVYEGGLGRICSLEDMGLRRSVDGKTALGILKEGGWRTWWKREEGELKDSEGVLQEPFLCTDLRTTVEDSLSLLPWAENHRSPQPAPTRSSTPLPDASPSLDLISDTQNSRGHLGLIRFLLSHTLTFGLDEETDGLAESHLGIVRPGKGREFGEAVESGCLSLSEGEEEGGEWRISEGMTGQRLLKAICLLRVFLNFPDTERYASQVILFYSSFLQEAVGPRFAFPSLEFFVDYWLDSSGEVQQGARLLFGAYLGSASDERVLELIERWEALLPTSLPPQVAWSTQSEKAVLLLGLIAAERFKLLPASLLKDIATSVTLFLDQDDQPYRQAIATELCLRGFEIWQNYVDAMPLVRQLFGLATGRNAITPNELRTLARLATLHVAGVNVPLFMTTLSLDILNAHSAAHRNATMKLLGFMVRKKPLVLHASLPRLAEAVVKSLDPTVTHLRETVQQAATVILNELVRTYPSIDFHGKSQRLAVGTHEGAAIVYDLKTATRLYVLEGHSRAVTALSFSPDGRRLVTVSLAESKAVVWKVGVGILSMFNPGAPPRQGSGGGNTTPFKSIEFAVGDEAHMTTAATLEWVTFEWPAERTTRLKIRETTLSFNV